MQARKLSVNPVVVIAISVPMSAEAKVNTGVPDKPTSSAAITPFKADAPLALASASPS